MDFHLLVSVTIGVIVGQLVGRWVRTHPQRPARHRPRLADAARIRQGRQAARRRHQLDAAWVRLAARNGWALA